VKIKYVEGPCHVSSSLLIRWFSEDKMQRDAWSTISPMEALANASRTSFVEAAQRGLKST